MSSFDVISRMDQPLTVGMIDIVSDLSDVLNFQSRIARLENIVNMLL